MNKLPEISVNEWLEAENKLREGRMPPQPKGSVTAVQFARMLGICHSSARIKLNEMIVEGLATKQLWRCADRNYCNVFFLKK